MTLIIFWISVSLIVYTLIGFPMLLWVRATLFPVPFQCGQDAPFVSVVIAAYNEEQEIVKRINNVLACDYPNDRLEVLIASDGSNDLTNELVKEYPNDNVRLFAYPRSGKGQVINATIPHAKGDVLLFSDANTHFQSDAIVQLTGPFADSTIGGVAGNQVYTRDNTQSLSADGEKSHWVIDTWLKKLQGAGGNVTSATGAIYALRKSIFEPMPDDSMDDFMISTNVVKQGYRLVFAKNAIGIEPVATKSSVEWSRKIRVITQGLRSVIYQRSLLNPFRYGFYSLQLFTHKVLRRVLSLPLIAIFLTVPFLSSEGVVYQIALVGQILIVIAALIGMLLARVGKWQSKVFSIPCFFVLVNLASLISLWNTVTGRRIKKWEPERHAGVNGNSDINSETVS